MLKLIILFITILVSLIGAFTYYNEKQDNKKAVFVCSLTITVLSIVLALFQYFQQKSDDESDKSKDRLLQVRQDKIETLQSEILLQQKDFCKAQSNLIQNYERDRVSKLEDDKINFVISINNIGQIVNENFWMIDSDFRLGLDSSTNENYKRLKKYLTDVTFYIEKEASNKYLKSNQALKLCFQNYYEGLKRVNQELFYGADKIKNYNCFYKFYLSSNAFIHTVNILDNVEKLLKLSKDINDLANKNYENNLVPN